MSVPLDGNARLAQDWRYLMARREWTRDELIMAFNLYCKIPFGRIHLRNPQVIELASAIGRSPSAVSWKLANFARLDPTLKKRNIAGASHGARSEIEIWDEFNGNWEKLSFESEHLLEKITGHTPKTVEEADDFPEGKMRETIVRTRVNQSFFRTAVLAAYDNRCCITGLSITALLNASHIVPWSKDIKNRTNPRNGLCLSAIHDRAFDCGLLTITADLKVKVSAKLKDSTSDPAIHDLIWKHEGMAIRTPRRFAPDQAFLQFHNESIFQN